MRSNIVCSVCVGHREWYVALETEALPLAGGYVPGRRFLQLVYVRWPKGDEVVRRRDWRVFLP